MLGLGVSLGSLGKACVVRVLGLDVWRGYLGWMYGEGVGVRRVVRVLWLGVCGEGVRDRRVWLGC